MDYSKRRDMPVNQLTFASKSQQRRYKAQKVSCREQAIRESCSHKNRKPAQYQSEWYCPDCGAGWWEET